VFINPYTGKILEVYTYKETFFYQVFALHRWLLGSSNGVGKVITGVSVLIFFFILLTGIILWWPRNAKILKQRLRIKTDASFKRLNHDLHVVLGFYTSIFLFAIVLSAISIAHNWFNDGIYKVTNSSKELPEAPESKFAAKLKPISFQDVLAIAESSVKNVDYYTIRKPKDSASVYNVQVLNADALEMAIDNYYIDQYQPKVVGSLKFADKNAGQQIKASMKSIHLGTFFGISSKTIWLIVSLLGFTFPITGVIMWLKRIKKKRKNTLSVN
jgi:uncharacterized iron-regulated membrane protein